VIVHLRPDSDHRPGLENEARLRVTSRRRPSWPKRLRAFKGFPVALGRAVPGLREVNRHAPGILQRQDAVLSCTGERHAFVKDRRMAPASGHGVRRSDKSDVPVKKNGTEARE